MWLIFFAFFPRVAGSKRVVCYYTNWSVYRPGTAKFSPQNINPYLCTHLIYAFGGLTRENGIRAYDKYQDIEQGGCSCSFLNGNVETASFQQSLLRVLVALLPR